ncbi:MAG: tRNA 2-thiouridine(34) synthase MnmA [Candidatus Pacebacteria bacterium]|nr:tRNA 2-thiouridine(34) synthase MnmA [Candidatus Paceibacterota bacterium]
MARIWNKHEQTNTPLKKKVFVALSGGVDSAVAAALLKEQGYEVTGIFMKFWQAPCDGSKNNGWNRCCSFESQQRARAVAAALGIRFYVLNFERQFKKEIVDYFLRELKAGRTPNPCVACNKEIKFGLLLNKALAIGACYVATGHYARLRRERNFDSKIAGNKGKSARLLKAKDKNKDQTYFLWQLNQKQLSKILFPIGEIASKSEVRKLAKKFNLPVAETRESQEVCFIKNTTDEFLKKYLKEKPGEIKNKKGEALGRHSGLWFYTIGQRKGIGLPGGPWFAVAKDVKKNVLIVSKDENDLLSRELIAGKVNWLGGEPADFQNIRAKIRYGIRPAKIKSMQKTGPDKYKIIFSRPQRAITPGQSVVFYKNDELLGGGVIVSGSY